MTGPGTPATTIMLASFFKRLEPLEPIVRIILSDAELSALFKFQGEPEKTVLLDFSRHPARISIDPTNPSWHILLKIPGDVMHDILTDKVKPGKALGDRDMLLRGSASKLGKFIPLFDFGPLLYREHLADMECDGSIRKAGKIPMKEAAMSEKVFEGAPIPTKQISSLEKVMFGMIYGLAYFLGRTVGFFRYRLFKNLSLFDLMAAMADGLSAAGPKK